MVFTLPPIEYVVDSEGNKKPSMDYINGRSYSRGMTGGDKLNKSDTISFELLNIFDLPLNLILRNIANTIVIIINELTLVKNYKSINSFLMIFIKGNRLMYLGIFVVFTSLFLSFFFF